MSINGMGPEFRALANALRSRVAEQRREATRVAADGVMAKALQLVSEGRLTALELAELHALDLQLEANQ
ncbi:hypothetical protein [Paracraurococcus lichenis]|uniref:Uncharacterized protein n=1 Tax=Paracraurococcus lichenis TaxID=3064888 RepID=A0ABT9ECS8_9PROT|nr:hypothetical protein [Paracraurococcus sp. LOR1-02]MDO9713783.1 hypothetical protein [Paracraurococcus sp. LOR1-02]